MASLDSTLLKVNVLNLRVVKNSALELAESKLSSTKKEFLESFQNHPVTKEIEAGESAENISGTLNGYGNLFSFIGFSKSEEPTRIVKNLIEKIRLINTSYKKNRDSIISFRMFVPSLMDFEKNTPIPWASGRSWLFGIEQGISGFGFFLSKFGQGRSGGGIESENKIRNLSYKRVSYFSKMYNNFIKKTTQ